MRIAFFGTPPFTTRFLDALSALGHTPALIVTNPDRPSGRGMKLTSPEPKAWGDARGIAVLQPEKLDDAFFDTLSKDSFDLFVVVAYGKIMPQRVIDLPRFGTVNVHYSLLPAYRGATPVESAILEGQQTSGVCIQQMRFKLDTGPILLREEISILKTDTTVTLRDRMNDTAISLLPTLLSGLANGTLTATAQDETLATYCGKITKEDGLVTLQDDPAILDRKFRAYQPWPGLFFIATVGGKPIRVKIKEAHLADGAFVIDTVIPENGKPLSWSGFKDMLS